VTEQTAKNAPRPTASASPKAPRELAIERDNNGRLIIEGRDGEMLSRKRKDDGGDPFHVPAEIIPAGWEYQWVVESVNGSKEIVSDQALVFWENGWRPVPADRHPGRYTPVGTKGDIFRGGMILMERPKALCDEARAEMVAKARKQMSDRDESLMGGKANVRGGMQGGFEMNAGKYRGTGGDLRISVDPAFDVPAPQHLLAEAGAAE
jgi:hypothetical protein